MAQGFASNLILKKMGNSHRWKSRCETNGNSVYAVGAQKAVGEVKRRADTWMPNGPRRGSNMWPLKREDRLPK
jgi:hypothetical protein